MPPLRVWLDHALGHRGFHVFLVVLAAAAYLVAYFQHPELPGNRTAAGWWHWQDQGKYLTAVEALRSGSLGRDTYLVSLGYPLMAVPFAGLWPDHPFLVPNLCMALGAGVLFCRITRRFCSRTETFGLAALLLVGLREELITTLVIPWTTIPTQVLTYGAIYLYLVSRDRWQKTALLSGAAGLTLLCRPVDGVLLLPLVVASWVVLPNAAQRLRGAASAMTILALCSTDRLLNAKVFGGATSRYEVGSVGRFFNENLLHKAYAIFMEGWTVYRVDEPMLVARFPWLLLALPGIVYIAKRLEWRALAPMSCVAGTWVLYLAYDFFAPTDLYHFNLIHYVAWTLPLFGLAAFVTVTRAWRTLSRWTTAASLGVGIFAGFVHLEELEATPGRIDGAGRVQTDGIVSTGRTFDLFTLEGASAPQRCLAPVLRTNQVPDHRGGGVFHLSEPVPLQAVRFPDATAVDKRAVAHRLRFRIRPRPAWIRP